MSNENYFVIYSFLTYNQKGLVMNIRLKDVSKVLKNGVEKVLLDKVNLEINEGEIVCIMGPSESGKTYLLKVLAGLESFDKGDIFLNNIHVAHLPKDKWPICTVYEDYFSYKKREKRKFSIPYFLAIRKWRKNTIPDRIKVVANVMGTSERELLGKMSHELSKGEQQKLDIARYLITKHHAYLFDNPLAALDAGTKLEIQQQLRRIIKTLNIPSVYVSYMLDEAKALSDKIIIMNKGKIEQTGKYAEIISHPANQFVSDFIGCL